MIAALADALISRPPTLTASPLFGITITLAAYVLALVLHARYRWLHPLLVTCVLIITLLLVGQIPISDYKVGGSIIEFFLGPATVALAVPLYKHRHTLARH